MESWILPLLAASVLVVMALISVFLLIPYSYKSFQDWVKSRTEKKLVASIEYCYLAVLFLSGFLVFLAKWVFYVG